MAGFIDEVSTPKRLSSYKIVFAAAAVFLLPDQNTANAISEQLSIEAANDIAFRQYVYLYLTKSHGAIRLPHAEGLSVLGRSTPAAIRPRNQNILGNIFLRDYVLLSHTI